MGCYRMERKSTSFNKDYLFTSKTTRLERYLLSSAIDMLKEYLA